MNSHSRKNPSQGQNRQSFLHYQTSNLPDYNSKSLSTKQAEENGVFPLAPSIQPLPNSSDDNTLALAPNPSSGSVEATTSRNEVETQSQQSVSIGRTFSAPDESQENEPALWSYRALCEIISFLLPRDIGEPWKEEVLVYCRRRLKQGVSPLTINLSVLVSSILVVANTLKDVVVEVLSSISGEKD